MTDPELTGTFMSLMERTHEAIDVEQARIKTLESAILTIIKSMNEYLPPTGGDKDRFISEVIGAVDNADIVAALRTELDHAK